MKQLKMIRMAGPAPEVVLPEGYRIELYQGTQKEVEEWLEIVADGLITPKGESSFIRSVRDHENVVPATDLFFVVDPNGRRVATTTAFMSGKVGWVHMVGSRREARGKGLGRAMVAYAAASFEKRGADYAVLTTDDHRLGAIKGYLYGGFRPVLREDPDSDMRARWEAVLEKLNYGPVEYLEDR